MKWHKGGSEATLVIAKMDWQRFSVGEFENWRLRAGAEPLRQGTVANDLCIQKPEEQLAASKELLKTNR